MVPPKCGPEARNVRTSFSYICRTSRAPDTLCISLYVTIGIKNRATGIPSLESRGKFFLDFSVSNCFSNSGSLATFKNGVSMENDLAMCQGQSVLEIDSSTLVDKK